MHRANEAAGEYELEVEGRILVLKPTLKCNLLVEKLTGHKFYGLLKILGDSEQVSLQMVIDIVTAGIRHGPDKEIKTDELEAILEKAGPTLLLITASQFIMHALGVHKMLEEQAGGKAGSPTTTG